MKSSINFRKFLFGIFFLSYFFSSAQIEDYTWQSVPLGGGGYITGMKIHPTNSDIRYYRTDIGGIYKWDAVQGRLRQILFSTNKQHYGVGGIALNPNNPAEVFIAVGRNCQTAETAIYKSYDYGESFSVVDGLPFYFATNGGRDCTSGTSDKDRQGSTIALNPLNTNELYIGTRDKGLYKMDLTTNAVTQLANGVIPTNTATEHYSIRSVAFHPIQQNYVIVGYANYGIYIGNTANQSYSILGDVNTYPDLKSISDISISKDGDYLMVACKLDGIWKCDDPLGAATWTKVLSYIPDPFDANNEGYLTVECSPHNNNEIVTCSGGASSITNGKFQFSINAGSTWNLKGGSVGTNIYPWYNSGIGSHISQIRFDPIDSKKLYFTSWFSTFDTDDWTAPNIIWSNVKSEGHEEIVTTDIRSFPRNSASNFLIINGRDQTGFLIDDITPGVYPNVLIRDLIDNPGDNVKGGSTDFCELNSDHIVTIALEKWDNSPAIIVTSNDGGLSFTKQTGYDESLGKAVVAMSSADPNNIVIVQQNHVQYTLDGGSTFTDANGVSSLNATCANTGTFNCLGSSDLSGKNLNTGVFSAFRMIEGDKVLPCVFYFYDWDDGSFHVSTDGGQNFCKVNDNTLPNYGGNEFGQHSRLTAVPGHAKHLWLNFNNSLYRSTDGGQTWTDIPFIDKAPAFGLGKAAPGASYPALYLYGSTTNTTENFYFRSDDQGATWIQINDHADNELWKAPKMIEGDREIYGRVYAGFSGLGTFYGDIAAPCVETELLVSNTFDDINSPNVPDWDFSTLGNAAATATINQWDNAVIDITNPGTFDYDIQLRQDNFAMTVGTFYVLKIQARADAPRTMNFKLRNRANGNVKYLDKAIDLLTSYQEYAFVIQAPVTDNDLRLVLLLGADANDVYLDYVSFEEYCADVPPSTFDCIEYIRLEDFDLLSGTYHAAKRTSSIGNVPSTETIIFKAGQEIDLDPGFSTELNAVFEALIEVCN